MDIRALLHNKWALGGVAAAAAVGVFVYVKHRNSASSTASSSTDSTGAQASPAYASPVGSFDSTGTDVASWLGSYSGNLQAQETQFEQTLASQISQQLAAGQTEGTTGAPGSGTLVTVTPPVGGGATAPVAKPAPAPSYVTATKYPSALGDLSGIAAYEHESLAQVEKLNPQIKNPNVIYAGEKIRVK